MAGSFDVTLMNNQPESRNFIVDLQYWWDGRGTVSTTPSSVTPHADYGNIKIYNDESSTAIPADFFIHDNNRIFQMSDLGPNRHGDDVTGVRLRSVIGVVNNWQGGVNGGLLVDSEGNRFFGFGFQDTVKWYSKAGGGPLSNEKTDANGDLYFGFVAQPRTGSWNTANQMINVQLEFSKHYG